MLGAHGLDCGGLLCSHTVDGRNPAWPSIYYTTIIPRVSYNQVMQDKDHHQQGPPTQSSLTSSLKERSWGSAAGDSGNACLSWLDHSGIPGFVFGAARRSGPFLAQDSVYKP